MSEKKETIAEEVDDFLNTIHNNADKIFNASIRLQTLANSFYITGNEIMGGELDVMSNILGDAQNKIRKAIGREISRQVKRADQSSKNMLMAALAGAGLKLEEEQKKKKVKNDAVQG